MGINSTVHTEALTLTPEGISAFINAEANRGVSHSSYSRTRGYLEAFYRALPEDKLVSRESLTEFREGLRSRGLSSVTVSNYSRAINQYLRFYELDSLCYTRGHSYDLTGQTFGYLTVIEKIGKKDRNDNYWLCKCKCGNTVEVMATQLVCGAAKSCGCLPIEKLQSSNRYIAGTQLNNFLDSTALNKSRRGSASGYRNIYYQKGKWVVRIVFQGKSNYCGTYQNLDNAIKARDSAMEEIVEQANHLAQVYEQLHSDDEPLPPNMSEFKKANKSKPKNVRKAKGIRVDNSSGCTGVVLHHGSWNAKINYKGVRYNLGTFKDKGKAISARKKAEKALAKNPEQFVIDYREYAKA